MREAERRGESRVTCRDVVELVTAYVESALPPDRTALVARHLGTCSDCQLYLEQLRITVAVLAAAPLPELPAQTRADLVASFEGRSPIPRSQR
jgi:anti-sigma factor RsiW